MRYKHFEEEKIVKPTEEMARSLAEILSYREVELLKLRFSLKTCGLRNCLLCMKFKDKRTNSLNCPSCPLGDGSNFRANCGCLNLKFGDRTLMQILDTLREVFWKSCEMGSPLSKMKEYYRLKRSLCAVRRFIDRIEEIKHEKEDNRGRGEADSGGPESGADRESEKAVHG